MKNPRMLNSLGQASGQSWAFFIVLAVIVQIFSGCGKAQRASIGNGVDSPIAMASHPTLPITYVLNAVLGGEYETGSLQSFSLSAGASPQLLSAQNSPRLGTAIAVAKTGEFLMAGFSGSTPEIQVYLLDKNGAATQSAQEFDRLTLPAGRIGTLQVVRLAGQQDWTVVASFADRSYEAQIFVYQYSPLTGFRKLLSTPGDFYSPSRDNILGAYTLAWGSPVVFESLGILAAFPYGTLGYLGLNPTALDWLSGKAATTNALSDLRTVSTLVVDLNRLISGAVVESSLGYAPIAFNENGKPGNPNADASSSENASYSFRTSYQSAYAIDSSSSYCVPNSPVASLAINTAVVATNGQSVDVIALGGFNAVAAQLRTRLEQGERQPVLGNVLIPQPVSMASQMPELTDIRTLIPQFQLIQSSGLCTLAWLRVEQRRSSLGAEKSRLQIVTAQSAAEQAQVESPLLGLASFSVNGSSILTGSFGTNQLQQFKFDGSKIQAGGLFQ